MTPCVCGCICFVQDLSPGLDKLSPKPIKCVFIGYSRTQKEYQCYNLLTRKYLLSNDIFFEFVLYFATQVPLTVSEIVPLPLSVSLPTLAFTVFSPVTPAETHNPPASKSVRDFRYVYTHCLKVPVSEPIPAIPSPVDGPTPPASTSPSDLDIPIVFQKGKWSCTDHSISNFLSYDNLNLTFHQFALSLSSKFILKSYTNVLLVPI